MINYQDGGFADWLPKNLIDSDTLAISYAFRMAMGQALRWKQTTIIMASVDTLPEEVVDLLALELRTQYYDETFGIDTKRAIVKNTLAWYMTAGTPDAVREMVETVFGTGEVVEWPDFVEEPRTPGLFDISTDAGDVSADVIKLLYQVVRNVKNASSHLRALNLLKKFLLEYQAKILPAIEINTLLYGLTGQYIWYFDGTVRFDGSHRFCGDYANIFDVGLEVSTMLTSQPKIDFSVGKGMEFAWQAELVPLLEIGTELDAKTADLKDSLGIGALLSGQAELESSLTADKRWFFNGGVRFDGSRRFDSSVEHIRL